MFTTQDIFAEMRAAQPDADAKVLWANAQAEARRRRNADNECEASSPTVPNTLPPTIAHARDFTPSDLQWALSNLDTDNDDAPSLAAYTVRAWARSSPVTRADFMKLALPRLMQQAQQGADDAQTTRKQLNTLQSTIKRLRKARDTANRHAFCTVCGTPAHGKT